MAMFKTSTFLVVYCCAIAGLSDKCDITNYPISVNVTYKWRLQVVCEMEGRDCVSLDVLRQYPGHEPSDMDCFGSNYLKRYCNLTLIEDVIIWCKAIYGTTYKENTSVKAEILVQDHLDPVTIVSKQINQTHITFSWNKPSILDGIEVIFNLFLFSINGNSAPIFNITNITTNSWTIDSSYLNPCTLGNLSIIAIADTLVSSNDLPNITFLHQPPISNFTIILNKHSNGNASFIMEYKEQCDCPGRQSTHSIVISHYTHHPSVSYIDIPVTIEECIGIIKSSADHQQTFIGNEDIIVDIWLKNKGGQTKQPSLKFNTNDIQDAHYIEGNITTGPCFQCVFENDVLINNSHAIGCNVSFLNINTTERNYTLLYRGNGSSSVFDCFSWFLSGYYDICYASLFFSEDCEVSQYSVYINGTNSETQADSTDDNLLPIIIGSSVSLLVIATLIIIVAMIAIKRCVSNRKTFSPASAEQAPGGNQEGVDEIVNRPTTSLLNAPTIAPYRYGGTLNELHDNAGPSSLNLSSDQSETRPLVNTTDRSSHSSDIIPLEERDSNLQQRKLSTVDEMETSFNDNQDNNTHSLNQMNTFVEDGDLGIPKILEPTSLSLLSDVLPTTNERRLETQQDISNDEDNDKSDEVFSYPEPLQATNIQTSNSLPNFSRHHHQPSFFRTNSETGDYLKELSAVPEDNDFISFEALN